ncbi:MAG TPA: GNAT family N-acetyltransferase [Bacteroidetes bacterium]|nr:GNAT family N-acetyltransferase [Bacteroidota bacterium]HRK05004.1 GNAT family N-acetyltransferase [Chlorobiota bacterium]
MAAPINIVPYTSHLYDEWDAFVRHSNNGTMFHMQRFLDYHPEGRWNYHHLLFYEGERLVAVLPGGINNKGEFWSPVGASYGSFVTEDTSFERNLRIVDAFIDYCRQTSIRDAYLIPAPHIYATETNQHHEYAMLYRKADFELHYISHAIDLRHEGDPIERFDATARKSIRKILREGRLNIVESDDYATFHDILVENKARHGVKPTHTLEELLRLRDLMPEHLRLNMVYDGDVAIAGSLLFVANRNVVLCFYNMLRYEYEHLRPIYLVMHEACRWSKVNGYRWVDIGVSQDTKSDDPMTPSLGLIGFKERFDSRGILRSTYHLRIEP